MGLDFSSLRSSEAAARREQPDAEESSVDFENRLQEALSASSPTAKPGTIANSFANAQNKSEALVAAKHAVKYITTNSTHVNAPLRDGTGSDDLKRFRDAVDYWIQNAPDYGKDRTVDRRVNFSPEFLEKIFAEGSLKDQAFTATTKTPMDPDASYPFRNTLLHIDAKWAADISHVSPDGHIQEHLILSNAEFRLVKGHVEKHGIDEEDFPDAHPVKARLWLEQMQPSAERRVPNPWTQSAHARTQDAPLSSQANRLPSATDQASQARSELLAARDPQERSRSTR